MMANDDVHEARIKISSENLSTISLIQGPGCKNRYPVVIKCMVYAYLLRSKSFRGTRKSNICTNVRLIDWCVVRIEYICYHVSF